VDTPITPKPVAEADEGARLAALHGLGVLHTPAEALLDTLVRSAAAACETPVALITLMDADRQWVKARHGPESLGELPRAEALCSTVIDSRSYIEIPDTRADARSSGRAWVRDAPHLCFYAAAPLATPEGHVIGSLCVLDERPRTGLAPAQRAVLQELARATMHALLLRQAAHRTLQSSTEQMFRELSENCPVGIFHTDAQGSCIYTNPFWQEIFGLSFEQSLGEGWARAIHPEDRAGVIALWGRMTASGRTFDQSFRVLRGDAQVVHVRARGRAIQLPGGSPGGYVGTAADISEEVRMRRQRERAVEALERSEERLHRALDGSGLALWDLDLPGERVFLSEQWSVMLGGEPRETHCSAQDLLQLVPEGDLRRIQSALEAVLLGRSSRYLVQHRVRRPDGTLLWVHSEGRVVQRNSAGRPLRMVGTNRDITQSRQAEEDLREARDAADQANRAKSQFLATMSHEIRTPLNGIIGMTKLLLDEDLTPQVRRHADLIDRSAHSLLSLVNDILDVSKIEAGQMDIEHVAFDLHELMGDLATLYRLRASEKSLLFRTRTDAGVPRFVEGDPTRIRQVLVNLLGNALKFTEAGSIVLETRATQLGGSQLVEFTVADTGIGIPPDVLPHLFQRFVQADSSTSRKFGGTGLGLSIVQQLVALMGGSVRVHSAPGEGSRFVVTLPLAQAQEPEPASAWQALPEPVQRARILVAEDNTTNQVVAFGMLRKLGFDEVRLASNGIEAFQLAMDEPFDVILMDCQMPEMDGYEATRRLRAAGCLAPIVAMTANAIKGDRERCIEAGMNDYLTKPMDLKVLGAILGRWAGRQPTGPGELPSLDHEGLRSRFGGDVELEQVALGTFRQTTPALLEKLRAACAADNRKTVALLAHSAKGGGSMVSAERYAAIAARLEERAERATSEEIGRLLKDLQRAFDDFVAALSVRRWAGSGGASARAGRATPHLIEVRVPPSSPAPRTWPVRCGTRTGLARAR
jgi:PAS domain S-box-containing protein